MNLKLFESLKYKSEINDLMVYCDLFRPIIYIVNLIKSIIWSTHEYISGRPYLLASITYALQETLYNTR